MTDVSDSRTATDSVIAMDGLSSIAPLAPSVTATAEGVFNASLLPYPWDHITPSADPVEVFASMARAAVPSLGTATDVLLAVDRKGTYEIRYPATDDDGAGTAGISETGICTVVAPDAELFELCHSVGTAQLIGETLVVPITSDPTTNDLNEDVTAAVGRDQRADGYRGVWSLTLQPGTSSASLMPWAELMVERATGIVRREQLADKVENLQRALLTNREIGMAIGVLMALHKVTAAGAFEMLRRASQRRHIKLAQIAHEVTETGELISGEGVAQQSVYAC